MARFALLCGIMGLASTLHAQRTGTLKREPQAAPAQLFRIVFQRQDPVAGLDTPAIRLPFQCTSDGTVFLGMIRPPDASKQLVASISPSRESHLFPVGELVELQDLYDKREIDHYASDSRVIFLVEAAREEKPEHGKVVTSEGAKEATRNAAERHSYIIVFDREGKYLEKIQVEDAFRVNRIGVFPSGLFLAYGWDEVSRQTKLALLKADGTVLEFLSPTARSMPDSPYTKKGPARFIAPVQFLPYGHSIIVARLRSDLPFLEVKESGALRMIIPKLPAGLNIDMLIPSYDNLYARVNQQEGGSIYEIRFDDGEVLSRFDVESKAAGASIACVYDGKFLSFEYGGGALVPLVGTRQPGVAPSQETRH